MNIINIIKEEISNLTKFTEDYSKLDRNNIYKILDDYDINDFHVDHYYGQDNYRAFLYEKGSKNILAKVEYSIYNNEITISIIQSFVKGKGYGKILMIYLAKKYGYENLKRSSLTQAGAKMRKELDNLFNFDYDQYIESQNKLIDNSEIDKIKNIYIKNFLTDLIENGNYAWQYVKDFEKYMEPYDISDIAEIAEYVKKSEQSKHFKVYSTEEPPKYVTDLLKKLQE
jgi:hypothetical protein